MSDDDESDHGSPVAFGADAGPTELELATRYANEDEFQCDMTGFDFYTLNHCFNLLHDDIKEVNLRLTNLEFRIVLLEREWENCSDKDRCEEISDTVAECKRSMASLESRLELLNKKLEYIDEIQEHQLSGSDTDVEESGSEGDFAWTWEEQGDPEEGSGESYEERDENEEERGAFEVRIDDNVLSGWRELLEQYQFHVDVVAFLGDTGLRDVDIQPFVDSAERGTAEAVQRGIDELQAIFSTVMDRRYDTPSPEDSGEASNPFYWYEQDLRIRHLDIAETVLEDLIFDLRERQDVLL